MEVLLFIFFVVLAVLFSMHQKAKLKISQLEGELTKIHDEYRYKIESLEEEKKYLKDWKYEIEPKIPQWEENSKLVDAHGKMAQELTDFVSEMNNKKREYDEFKDTISEFQYYQELEESGVYSYKFNFQDIEKYDKALNTIKEAQKVLIKEDKAFKVNNKELVGSPIIKNISKLALNAFNASCNELVNSVKFNNYDSCEKKLQKSFEQINKLVAPFNSEISKQYYKSKVKELALSLEFELEKKQIKDEQDQLKAQMREEQKELAQAEKARDKAIEEEKLIADALEKARLEIESKTDAEKAEYENKIKQLEEQLAAAHTETERKIANAQITSVGHVYIISNIGSFGEKVFKIGMTRRDEPLDRVKELGDASVPFSFDVHALIFSDNARKLEADLHNVFDSKRMNKINKRKEFFEVELQEIQKACSDLGHTIKFTKLAEAREYRETLEFSKDNAA